MGGYERREPSDEPRARTGGDAVAYVTVIGAAPEQVEYRLAGGHGCSPAVVNEEQLDYHADATERPLVWTGAGLAEVGIEAGSVLDEGQFDDARALMSGVDPRTGARLVEPKLAIYEDAKVAVAPLVAELEEVAAQRGIAPVDLFAGRKEREGFERAQRSVERYGAGARLRADEAGALADRGGLDVDAVWGEGVFAGATANLSEVRIVVGADGRAHEEVGPRRKVVGNMGYDVSFTLPKSHSLLMAFAEEESAQRIEGTYTSQVGATFDWLEAQTAYGMRGQHGGGKSAETVAGTGFLGWSMVHRAARPVGDRVVGDPHWHVHVSIANMTRGGDGQWSTVAAGGRDLMRHAPAADHVLKALVRHQLIEEFGVAFARSQRTGAWEVEAIPDSTLRAFSKRGASIEAMLRDLGFDPEHASRRAEDLAAAQTRQAKDHTTAAPDEDLRATWQAEARALGVDPAAMAAAALRGPGQSAEAAADAGGDQGARVGEIDPDAPPAATLEQNAQDAQAAQMQAIVGKLLDADSGLTGDRRRFSRVHALAAVADAMPGGASTVQEIERVTDAALADIGFVPLSGQNAQQIQSVGGQKHELASTHMANADRWTTADVVAAEKVILTAAKTSADGQGMASVSAQTAALARSAVEAGQGFELSGEQGQIMHGLVTSDRALDAVLGPPGTGKTTLMRAARTAWEAEGYVVAGAATAAVAAANLSAESGIESRTVAQWVHAIEHGRGLAGVDVLVLDEANLTDDRDRATIYRAALDAGTKVVEIGDPQQLRGVGCGSLFGRVHEAVGGGELSVNRRQRDEDERATIATWREGKYAQALESWSGRGRLVATESGHEAMTAMVASWMSERAGAPNPHAEMRGVVMLAATNEAVERLNDAAQAVRSATGELGEARTYQIRAGREVTLHEGDHVLIRLNDRKQRLHAGPDVLNGYRGVIENIDQAGAVAVCWQQPGMDGHDTQRASLSPAYIAAGGLSLGYAMTGHKAEGMTVEADWTRPDGVHQGGSVLVHGVGMDEPGMHVATSRHRDRVHIFAGRDQLEDANTTHDLGVPSSAAERQERVIAALAEHAATHSATGNDTPVADDLRAVTKDQRQGEQDQAQDRWRTRWAEMREEMTRKEPVQAGPPTPEGTSNDDQPGQPGRRTGTWAEMREELAKRSQARETSPATGRNQSTDVQEAARVRAEQDRRRREKRHQPDQGRSHGPSL